MKTQSFQIAVNIPSLEDFSSRFPQYGPFAYEQGRFLFDLIMSPSSFIKAKVATIDLDLPAVAGVAKLCHQTVIANGTIEFSTHIKQFIGATVCVLMEANNFQKSGRKKAIPYSAFSKGEVYEFVEK
jgi:hypothetical protein